MEIVIFGSGNVAWSLGHLFHQSGIKILKVVSRNTAEGKKLAAELSSEFQHNSECDFRFSRNIVCFLCYPDDVLRQIAEEYLIKDCIVVHTAGSVSIDVLKNISQRVGVFYPLQTFRTNMPVNEYFPIFLDAGDLETLEILKDLASSISNKIEVANDSKREKVHLAAVLVNNFTNHLFALTSEYCKDNNIDFKLLMPLMKETIKRNECYTPNELQTGPARRNDQKTINRHLQMIENYPDILKIYSIFTESILNHNYPNK